ncbi:MAG: CBS domain-containing protein [Acidobacteria bacterium]|nr:CBS domain-containing protein [Acidobacteriota bacterium]
MRGWSLRIFRIFGVDVRMHPLMVLVLFFSLVFAKLADGFATRGFGLWVLMLLAIAVREIGRGFAAAWCGMQMQSLIILPTGGIATYGLREDRQRRHDLLMALSGPLANFFIGICTAMLLLAVSPSLRLFDRPYITSGHLIRALMWTQIFLGGIHMIPAVPLDAGVLLRRNFMRLRGAARGARAAAGISQMTGIFISIAGIAFQNIWTMAIGASIVIGWQTVALEDTSGDEAVDSVRMRDVMLSNFTTLGASDTLEEALNASIHSLQDIFPVTRGPLLVGSVSRQALSDALLTGGNSYVQGVMTRSLHVASADDPVVSTLRKLSTEGTQMLPVVEGGRVVGIVTPQNLSMSMGLLGRTRRLRQRLGEDAAGE